MVKDLDYSLKLIESTEDKLSDTENAPIKNGQYIVCIDSGNTYYDSNNKRNLLSDVIVLDTDSIRQGLEKGFAKLYYVKDTNHLWFYNDDWIDITVEDSDLGNHVVVSEVQPESQKENDIWLKIIKE